MPWAKEAGCIVVDNSSAYRLDEDVPLVIPEVNKEDIKNHHGLIANPNCATIIALVALHALHKKYHIKRMIVTTFQAVSGAGVQGIEDLKNQTVKIENSSDEVEKAVLTHFRNFIKEDKEYSNILISEILKRYSRTSRALMLLNSGNLSSGTPLVVMTFSKSVSSFTQSA